MAQGKDNGRASRVIGADMADPPQQVDLFGDELPEVFESVAPSRIHRRVVDAATSIAMLSEGSILPEYLHSVLCQLSLPRNATEARVFERTSGQVSIRIKAGELHDGQSFVEQLLPYGSRPRLVLVHVCSQAIRTQSRDVEVGKSAREFLDRIGIKQSTGG